MPLLIFHELVKIAVQHLHISASLKDNNQHLRRFLYFEKEQF